MIINAIATHASVDTGTDIAQSTASTAAGLQSEPAYSFTSSGASAPDVESFTQGSTLKVVVIEKAEELLDHAASWQDLADHAMESNVFYEPWMLVPAVKKLGLGKSLRFILIYQVNPLDPVRVAQLHGFFPMELLSRFRNLPIRAVRLWKHLHCFLCTPLVRAEGAGKTLAALLEWAATGAGAAVVDFSPVAGDGPFHRLLVEHSAETGATARITSSSARALWKRGENIEAYLRGTVSGGILKEYRRQRRRLAEMGVLEFKSLHQADDAIDSIEKFMRLEASGWKARAGTALQRNEDQRAYVQEVAQNGFARGQVLLHGLFLDGQAVAMLLSFRAGVGIFAFKIAYDEAFAKYSPGVQMTLELLAHLHADSRFGWIDSCAVPNHSMVSRLLKDRRIIETVLISTGGWAGDLLLFAYPAGKWLRGLICGKNSGTRSKGVL
ncbi:MAG: GNAT family N-acetyltransferase [Burkholderiales bacterium]